MPNAIAVSITADIADLTAKRAIASAELKALQKDLNDLANTARTGGKTPELAAALLAAGDAAAKAKSQVALIDQGLKQYAVSATSAHMGTAGITRELLVLSREASRGNLNRMAGSATILAQRMGLLTPTVLGTAAAIAGIAAPAALFLAAAEQGSEQLAKFQNAMEATNGYAGVTVSQLQDMARELSNWAHEGVGSASKELMALVASGRFTGQTLQLVGADATRMSQLTGEAADKWNAEFEKMSDGVAKFAAEYQARYGQLTTAQFAYIQQLEQQGHKEQAEYALAKDIYDYLGKQAPQNLGYLERAWRSVGEAIAGAWDALKAFGRDSNADKMAVAQSQIAYYERLKSANGGTNAYDAQLAAARSALAAVQGAEAAEQRRAQATAAATERQKEGVTAAQKLHEQFEASRASGEKLKAALQEIDVNLKKAVAADPANQALYEREAAAARAQAQKADAPKGTKGPDVVSEWTEQLHAQEIASGEFFRDQTQAELKFWQDKLSLTTAGSKDYLAVQEKIFTAQKTLAHQAYDDQLAMLNDQLEADRDNWSKEQADWNAKLEFIKSQKGVKSREYEDAHREFERAEREHEQRMGEIRRQGAQEQLAALQESLRIEEEIRQRDAQTQEELIKARAQYSANPFAEAEAQRQISQLQAQAIQRQIEALNQEYAARSAVVAKEIADAGQAARVDVELQRKLVEDKKKLDEEYYNRHRVLVDQAANQEIQAQQRVEAAWHAKIDPMVHSAGSAIQGLITGTMTWQQAIASVGEALLGAVVGALEDVAEKMIVNAIMQRTTQTASTEAGIKQAAALAGANGVASMAGAPFPMDLTAPAFGAKMALVAGAFSLGGFEKGVNVVPQDMIAQIHAGERIVPASDNRKLIAAAEAGAAGPGAGARAQPAPQPAVTYEVHIHAMDAKSAIATLEGNPREFQRAIERAMPRIAR